MEIIDTTADNYRGLFAKPYHVFNSADFNELNKDKCDETFHLLFKDGKYRLGIIVGVRDKTLLSPYSAPFGGFSYISQDIRIQYLDTAIELLEAWAKGKGIEKIRLTLPPAIYEQSFIAKQINSLFRHKFQIETADLNYHFILDDFNDQYHQSIWRNARKNLNIALESGLLFKKVDDLKERQQAYEIIKANRESKGFPLRMSQPQVMDTTKIIPADFFIVKDNKDNNIGSAIVFTIQDNVAQVVYWGDLPAFSKYKTMNFLSYKLFEHYKGKGYKIVDIGPSTEDSLPNYGLCEFKESIGCRITVKHTLTKFI